MKLKLLLSTLTLVVIYYFYSNMNGITFNTSPSKITLEVHGNSINISNKNEIDQIMQVVNSNRKTTDHKCGDIGQLTLVYEKDTISLSLLPGHNNGYLEFRYKSKIYQINESQFFAITPIKPYENKFTHDNPNDYPEKLKAKSTTIPQP